MPSLNKVMLIGNATRDPEIRYTPKGNAVTDLGIAVNRKYRVDDEMREETTYVDITFWGRQAETIANYLKKGNAIYVEGRLQLDSWEDKNTGQRRNRLRVVGDSFQFLGGPRQDGGGGGGSGYSSGGSSSSGHSQSNPAPPPEQSPPPQSSQQAPPQQSSPPPSKDFEDDDDIPF